MKKNNFLVMPEKIFGVSSGLIKLFLPLLGVAIFLLMSLGWLILPKIESAKSLKSSGDSIKSQIKSIDEKISYLMSVDQEQLKQNASYLSSAVLKEKNSYLLLGVLKDITEKFGYGINSFSLSIEDLKGENDGLKVADKDIAVKMPLVVEVAGPPDKFVDFIKAIENSLPILFIDGLENNQNSFEVALKMTISSYYLPDTLTSVSENLTISDLKLTKEESDLLAKIGQFERGSSLENNDSQVGSFVEYNRPNPF